MRMFNPEWEAIKEFQHAARFMDFQYDLTGAEIPADHGYALFEELARHLPWLRDTPEAGVHPVHGAPSGRNDNLVINRRVKLVLRLPVARREAAQALVGCRVDPGAGTLVIGDLKERPLMPFKYLYSHFMVAGTGDEQDLLASVKAELDAMEIAAGLICGKGRTIRTPEGEAHGHSLMLHDVKLEDSIRVQESGLGKYRGYGCGIFIPHKSIKEVAME